MKQEMIGAVASPGPKANHLHLAPVETDNHVSTSSLIPDALPDTQPTVSKD